MNQSEIRVFSLETVTKRGGVAVARGETICSAANGSDENVSLSEWLLPAAANVLARAQTRLREVDLIAAVNGPGSFTGLRIGLATAKAFAAALQIPVVGVSTLEAAAFETASDKLNCVVFPAGRGEVFAQYFQNEQNNLRAASEIESLPLSLLLQRNCEKQNLSWIAPPAIENEISAFARENEIEASENNLPLGKTQWSIARFPENLAICAAKIAARKYRAGDFNSEVTAIYMRSAEVNRK